MSAPDPRRWGVEEGFWDMGGQWRPAPEATVETLLALLGADAAEPPAPPAITVRLDHPLPPVPEGQVVTEDGGEVDVGGPLPPDLPPGYHRFEGRDGESFSLIVSPGRCPLPAVEQWGFASQLYATRSAHSWGIGDLADLSRLASWSSDLGAGLTMVNPLHAASPTGPQQPSPYSAGSRCFHNPIYVAVARVPGFELLADAEAIVAAGQALNDRPLIQRDPIWSLKSRALRAIFDALIAAGRDPTSEVDWLREQRGSVLDRFATYCALAESHGSNWQAWPGEYRHPDNAAVAQFAGSREGSRRILYHAWLQALVDSQLSQVRPAGNGLGVVADLAVGVDATGADAWIFQDAFAFGAEIGAPPDEFNTQGQGWGLPPLDPWKLRSCAYEPWVHALRGSLRHAGGIRVDHVMGLFRQYWIPPGCETGQGAYVRYPHDDLLNILSLEADRSGAVVVGEDLGTVEDRVRADLYERDVLACKVWWFEPDRPSTWPVKALGSVTTHDLPTVSGVYDRSDVQAQRECGMEPNQDSAERMRQKLLDWTGSDEATEQAVVVERAYEDLGRAPCLLLAASLDDALQVNQRPNMPGTVDEWPNWRLPLPLLLEDLEKDRLPRSIASHLNREQGAAGS